MKPLQKRAENTSDFLSVWVDDIKRSVDPNEQTFHFILCPSSTSTPSGVGVQYKSVHGQVQSSQSLNGGSLMYNKISVCSYLRAKNVSKQ